MSEQLVARVGRVAGPHGGRAYSFQVRFEAYELNSHCIEAPINDWVFSPLKKLLSMPSSKISHWPRGLCLLAVASGDTTLSYSSSLVGECWLEEALNDDGRRDSE